MVSIPLFIKVLIALSFLELIDQDSLGPLDVDLMDFNGELTDNVEKSANEIIELFGEIL